MLYVSSMESMLEAALLRSTKDMFGLYRLKTFSYLDEYRGKTYAQLCKEEKNPHREFYMLVYVGELMRGQWIDHIRKWLSRPPMLGCERLGSQQYRPMDFTTKPPAVGDIFVLQIEGGVTAHYLNEYDSFDILPRFMDTVKENRRVVAITQVGVEHQLDFDRKTVPGYILEDGAVLLEDAVDAHGNYFGASLVNGVYLKTGTLYRPAIEEGKLIGFINITGKGITGDE